MTDREQNDLDLMLAYDGELDDADLLSDDADDSVKLRALGEISELVRGYVELETDEADERLSALWDNVERRIHTNGQSAPATPAPEPAEPGFVGRLLAWFESYRGHFVTGAVSAAAVALIMIAVGRPTQTTTTTVIAPTRPLPVAQTKDEPTTPTPPEVESLEVYQGTGTILSLPNDDGGETSVIWLAPEDAEDTMEDPI